MIAEIEFNQRIQQFDKLFLTRRLKEMKKNLPLKSKDVKAIMKEIKAANKGIKMPQHKEICMYLEQIADALYVFISRPQVQQLGKLGILMEHLSDMLASNVRRYRVDLHQAKIKEQEQQKIIEA